MRLQSIKMTLAGLWVLLAVGIGIMAEITSAGGRVALVAFGLLPPLAMLLMWNEPSQTLSESINEQRR